MAKQILITERVKDLPHSQIRSALREAKRSDKQLNKADGIIGVTKFGITIKKIKDFLILM